MQILVLLILVIANLSSKLYFLVLCKLVIAWLFGFGRIPRLGIFLIFIIAQMIIIVSLLTFIFRRRFNILGFSLFKETKDFSLFIQFLNSTSFSQYLNTCCWCSDLSRISLIILFFTNLLGYHLVHCFPLSLLCLDWKGFIEKIRLLCGL